jgi:hypothetical protein
MATKSNKNTLWVNTFCIFYEAHEIKQYFWYVMNGLLVFKYFNWEYFRYILDIFS